MKCAVPDVGPLSCESLQEASLTSARNAGVNHAHRCVLVLGLITLAVPFPACLSRASRDSAHEWLHVAIASAQLTCRSSRAQSLDRENRRKSMPAAVLRISSVSRLYCGEETRSWGAHGAVLGTYIHRVSGRLWQTTY
ncbi:hypothetical protein OH77DRAFT_1199547 [Trametes cingulata]|nr:hypothetical protein OH77DRAFT_1199547 [Trametes cingulata]